MSTKLCRKCGEVKPTSLFSKRTYKSGKTGLQSKCKECEKNVRRQYWKPHEKIRRQCNISEAEFQQLVSSRTCDICFTNIDINDKLCIDHDHKTNKVRGTLCHRCNTALGLFLDNIDNLRQAVLYLEKNI